MICHMTMMLHWLAGYSLGQIGGFIGSGLIFIVSLSQLVRAISKQDHKAIRENTALLLMSVSLLGSVLVEGVKPLKLLSEVLSWVGAAFSCLFLCLVIFGRKKITAVRKVATNPIVPSDDIWPPPPTSPGGGQP